MAPAEEKRIDAEDGQAYTWDDISNHYRKKYKQWEVDAYWEAMKPVKGKGKGKATASAGKKEASGKACTVCGKDNHTKADCKFKDKECSNCGKVGHLAKVCRQEGGGAGGDKKEARPKLRAKKEARVPREKRCFNCGETGHAVADCTSPKLCKCCGSADHARDDCPKKDDECAKCGKKGHIEAICRGSEKKEGDKERPPREKRCFNCGEVGHPVAECTKGKLCNCCGSPDHEIKDCPKKDEKCDKCGKKGHVEARCRKA